MKQIRAIPLLFALLLCLTACQSKDSQPIWTESHAQDILSSGAFSEELEPVDEDTAFALYKLADYGIDRDQLTGSFVRRSAGATCEEIAVLTFSGEQSATSAATALRDYLQSQIAANQNYRPAEIPKLENAWVSQRGCTLLMVAANDLSAAKAAVGE